MIRRVLLRADRTDYSADWDLRPGIKVSQSNGILHKCFSVVSPTWPDDPRSNRPSARKDRVKETVNDFKK